MASKRADVRLLERLSVDGNNRWCYDDECTLRVIEVRLWVNEKLNRVDTGQQRTMNDGQFVNNATTHHRPNIRASSRSREQHCRQNYFQLPCVKRQDNDGLTLGIESSSSNIEVKCWSAGSVSNDDVTKDIIIFLNNVITTMVIRPLDDPT